MDDVRTLLELIGQEQLASGRLAGVFHIFIGRRIAKADGTAISNGITWRQLANALKAAKFDREIVRELGVDPDELAPRDREKMWYLAVGLAKVDSVAAIAQADKLALLLKSHGYIVGPSPTLVTAAPPAAARAKKK